MTPSLILLVAGAAGAALVVAAFWVARPGVDPPALDRVIPRDPPVGATLLDSLAGHLIAPVRSGNHFELKRDAGEIFPAMGAAVAEATSSVDFLTYLFRRGRVASRVVDALERAARRGVAVRVLVDGLGSFGAQEDLVRLEEAGAQVARFHPLGRPSLDRLNQRTHRKVLVVDRTVGFLGGVGVADEWAEGPEGPPWREDQYRVTGPAVADLLGAFAENWRQATGDVLLLGTPPRQAPEGSARAVPLLDRPGGGISHFRLALWMGLRAAREQVRIRTPYFLPGVELRRAMADAVARGVRVQVLLPGPSNDSRLVRLASRARYADYLAGGLELYEFQPRMMHAKSVTVDGRLALLGSHNVDHRSLRLSFEFSFAVDDPVLVAAMDGAFDDDVAEAQPMDGPAVAARGALERIAGGAVGVIEGYL